MILYVGQASIKGDFRKYTKHFNYVELLAEPQVLPNLKKLAQLVQEAGERVKFGVVLSPRAWGADGTPFRAYFDKVVKATNPAWVLVRTPTSFRPGQSNERELQTRVEELRGKVGSARIAWEARGLWEPAMIARAAREAGVVPVWDGYSLPTFSLGDGENYVRFSALGVAGRVNEGRLERLAVQAQDSSSLFVVVEGKGALKTRQLLSSLLEDPFAGVEGGVALDELGADGQDGEVDDFELPDEEDSDEEDSDEEDSDEEDSDEEDSDEEDSDEEDFKEKK
jgi:hypothetical protein